MVLLERVALVARLLPVPVDGALARILAAAEEKKPIPIAAD